MSDPPLSNRAFTLTHQLAQNGLELSLATHSLAQWRPCCAGQAQGLSPHAATYGVTTKVPAYQTSPQVAHGDFEFRTYRLVPGARLLLKNGRQVKLGSRAFDLLHILLASRGSLVTKDQIVRFVWPETTVEESNLRFQMGCLRKALGRDRDLIKTIPGRGYVFATEAGSVVHEIELRTLASN